MLNDKEPKTPVIFLEDVKKQYQNRSILTNIEFQIYPGEIVSLIGPSGAGKSTLVRLILGDETPDTGIVRIHGKAIDRPTSLVGYVPQLNLLEDDLTVLENTCLGLSAKVSLYERWNIKKMMKLNKEWKEKAFSVLRAVDLEEHAHQYPGQLSGGMRQRASIASCLIMEQDIIILDEATSSLDEKTKIDIENIILKIRENNPKVVFINITHDLRQAFYLSSRVMVLSQYFSDPEFSEGGATIIIDELVDLPWPRTSQLRNSESISKKIIDFKHQGFNPDYLQPIKDFRLTHPNAYLTTKSTNIGKRPENIE